jgi:uncharacterized protein
MHEFLRILLMTFILLAAMARSGVTGPLEDAQIAIERRDYSAALGILRPLAEQGDPVAQYRLGSMYIDGHGVPKDNTEGIKWYRRAAEQNNTLAQRMLGYKYEFGQDVTKDLSEAANWLRRAADLGDAEAQAQLANMYYLGEGVHKDMNIAASWFLRSAQQGFADAQAMIGLMYWSGEGVPQDYVLAHMWTNLAASHPLPDAGPNIVTAMTRGIAAGGQSLAIERRNKIAREMTREQIAEAQRLTREWRPKPER